jgi:UDP-N-acetylglucosamine:LPS N-acetylglucosamine transferase
MGSLTNHSKDFDVLAIGVNRLRQKGIPQRNNTLHKIISLSSIRLSKQFNILRLSIIYIEYWIKLSKELNKAKPKLIYALNFSTLLPVVFYKVFNKKIIVIYHARELESKQRNNWLFSFIVTRIEQISKIFIDLIITPSDSITKWYSTNLNKKAVTLFNTPVVDRDFRLDKNYFRNKFGIPEEKKIFVHSGALGVGRNIDLLVEIFDRSELGSLVLIGPIRSEEFNYIAENQIQNVYYHEPVKYKYLVKYLSTASVGLIMFDNEVLNREWALPNKFFEYVNAHLPIISSNFKDMTNLIKKYDLGLSITPSKECFIEAICQMKEQKNEFYKEVPLELTWEFQEKKFLRLINELFTEGVNK